MKLFLGENGLQIIFSSLVLSPNQVPTFGITDTKCYVPVVTLLTQGKMKLPKQLESGFKRTKNLNNYQSKKDKSNTKPIFKSLS